MNDLSKTIHDLMTEKDINFYRLGKASGLDPGYISRITNGEIKSPSLANIAKIAEGFNQLGVTVTANELIAGQSLPQTSTELLLELKKTFEKLNVKDFSYLGEVSPIPIKGYVPAGVPCIKEQTEGEYVLIARERLAQLPNPESLYALVVTGESLAGDGIHKGDKLLVRPQKTVDIDGKIYICRIANECTVKRVFKTLIGYTLKSSNSEFQDIVPEELEILGRVVMLDPEDKLL